MRVGIFYFLPLDKAGRRQDMGYKGYDSVCSTLGWHIVGYVRCEVVEAETLVDALDMATPRDGE